MESNIEFKMNGKELVELLMSAWADGWMSKEQTNDDRKRVFAFEKIQEIRFKNTGKLVN